MVQTCADWRLALFSVQAGGHGFNMASISCTEGFGRDCVVLESGRRLSLAARM